MRLSAEGGLTKDERARRQDDLIDDRKAVVKTLNCLLKHFGQPCRRRTVAKGVARYKGACPVAMTLRDTPICSVDVTDFWVQMDDGGRRRVAFTSLMKPEEAKTLARFVRHIDQGLYPELEIPKSTVKVNGEVIA